MAGAVLPPATAVLGPAVARMGRSVVVVPVRGLDDLAGAVRGATADLGQPPDPRGFRGHLTLARLHHRGGCGVAGARVDGSWEVGEVELVSSVTDPAGAVHEVLARFPVPSGPSGRKCLNRTLVRNYSAVVGQSSPRGAGAGARPALPGRPAGPLPAPSGGPTACHTPSIGSEPRS